MTIEDNVVQNPKGYETHGTSRFGTVHASVEQFTQVFGGAHEEDPSGDKVTKWWFFETPRGRVSVRDWWANPEDELCLCAVEPKATIWAAAYFRRCNIKAYSYWRFMK